MATIANAPSGENTSPARTVKIPLSGSQYAQIANLLKNFVASPAQGQILYYDGSNWVALDPGTSGYVLQTAGAAANPAWASAGPSTSFDATITNLTLGAGTRTGKYVQTGKLVHFDCSILFAADTSVGGGLSLTLPVTAATYSIITPIGIVRMKDATGGNANTGFVLSNGTITVFNASGTYATGDPVTATVPFTWATSDELAISGTYIAA